MANAKIEIKLGTIEFSGEGEQGWVTDQLDKILELVPKLTPEIASNKPANQSIKQPVVTASMAAPSDLFSTNKSERVIPDNLSTFLRKKDAIDKQRRRFLGTAVWLQLNGQQVIKTKDVTDALRAARQIKITNPSHQLNQNIAQGFCQKEGTRFYVTPQGIENIM